MEMRGRLEQANDNAAGFWLTQARAHGWESLRRPGFTAVRCARDHADAHRLVVTRPYSEPRWLEEELAGLLRDWGTTQLCLEDPYGGLDLSRFGCVRGLGMAVMTREPVGPPARGAAIGTGSPGGTGGTAGLSGRPRYGERLTICEAVDGAGLAAVERTVVEGFPIPARRPWVRGAMLPVDLLSAGLLPADLLARHGEGGSGKGAADGAVEGAVDVAVEGAVDGAGETAGAPGIRAWLARVDGQAAGGCLTYDDGETVGLYWVSTLAGYRSRGVARGVLEAALGGHPGRPATLVSTLLGEPLYRKLGFVERGVTCWWGYPVAPGAR